MRKIVSGDRAMVISGSDKGKIGTVLKVLNKERKYKKNLLMVVVSGINLRKCVMKSKSGKKFETKEFPVNYSNLSLVCSDGNFRSRVGFKVVDGVKKRYLKSSGELLN